MKFETGNIQLFRCSRRINRQENARDAVGVLNAQFRGAALRGEVSESFASERLDHIEIVRRRLTQVKNASFNNIGKTEMGIDPKFSFFFGAWTSILHGIATGAVVQL